MLDHYPNPFDSDEHFVLRRPNAGRRAFRDEIDRRSDDHFDEPPSTKRAQDTRAALSGEAQVGQEKPVVRLPWIVLDQIEQTVGRLPAERGGIFVGGDPFAPEGFIFDKASDPASSVYYPSADYLNEIVEREHEPFGRRFVGVGHSHPVGLWRPSGSQNWGDIKAARNNLLAKGNEHLSALFIPIIESRADTGRFRIYPFVMLREDFKLCEARLEIVDVLKNPAARERR